MSEQDRLLVTRAQSGDAAAFEALVERYSKPIYGLILRMVRGNREEAEDLAQETMLRAFKAIGRFRQDSKFSTWLHRIAVNLTLNRLKKKSIKAQSLSVTAPDDEQDRWMEIPDETFGPEKRLLRAEMRHAMEAALARLSDNLRAVFILREIHGMSHDEIAETLESTSKAVRVRHHRAKKELVGYLEELLQAGRKEGRVCG